MNLNEPFDLARKPAACNLSPRTGFKGDSPLPPCLGSVRLTSHLSRRAELSLALINKSKASHDAATLPEKLLHLQVLLLLPFLILILASCKNFIAVATGAKFAQLSPRRPKMSKVGKMCVWESSSPLGWKSKWKWRQRQSSCYNFLVACTMLPQVGGVWKSRKSWRKLFALFKLCVKDWGGSEWAYWKSNDAQ